MKSSLNVWPSCKRIYEEMIVPLNIIISPSDNSITPINIPSSEKHQCTKCSAYVSDIFTHKDGKFMCPFCGTVSEFLVEDQFKLQDYVIQDSPHSLNFYICFVFDLRCKNEFIQISECYLKIALQALLPGFKFAFILLHGNFLSFLKIYHGKCISFDFSLDCRFFELASLDFLLNQSDNIDPIIDYISGLKNIENIENSENLVHFEDIFKPVPKDKFIHFIVFTSLCEKFSKSHNISFDLISPSKIKKSVHIDGLSLSQLNVEDIGLQIQALVQRLEFNNFALNVRTCIFAPPLIEVTPQSIKRSSLRKGTSFTFNISLSKTTTTFTEFPVQIICEYDEPIGWNRCIHKIYVSSRLFKSSSDFYSILSSVKPEFTAYNFLNQENLQKLFNLYNSKIINSLPGENIIDPFFTLLPRLRWYIRFFLFGHKNRYHSTLTCQNNLIAVHFPQVSFWSDENTISAENVECISFTEEIVGKPLIIVVDHDYKIEIYTSTTINPQSGVDSYIQEKIISRFPVPRLTINPMEKFGRFIIPEEKWAELIPNLFK